MTTYIPGKYRIINGDGVQVRGTPNNSHDGNIVRDGNGARIKITMGKMVDVQSIADDTRNNGWVWGVITMPNVKQTLYICLYNLNTRFVEMVDTETASPATMQVLLERLIKLEAWARTQGYSFRD